MSPAKKKQKDTLPTSPAMRELKALASTPQAVTRLKPVVPAPNGHDIAVRAYAVDSTVTTGKTGSSRSNN
jgi:hypothetical protein